MSSKHCSDHVGDNGSDGGVDGVLISKTETISPVFPGCNRCKINCKSAMIDEGCATNVSPYSSSSEDDSGHEKLLGTIARRRNSIGRDKVARSSSSDSALGLEEDIQQFEQTLKDERTLIMGHRRMTLTVGDIPLRSALLPLASPINLPEDSKLYIGTPSINDINTSVPSKIILEANIIEMPHLQASGISAGTVVAVTSVADGLVNGADDSGASDQPFGVSSPSDIRRVSSQSDFDQRIRYVRTPSVVVSDYSDDVYGSITLEEIEFLRQQRLRRISLQDIDHYDDDDDDHHVNHDHHRLITLSAASSCSNLNFIGSTISGLDTIDDDIIEINPVTSELQTPERKISSCSTCSTGSGDGDNCLSESTPSKSIPNETKKPSGWRKLRNIVQWTPFFQTYKKQRYPWVQLAGHQGNFKAGPDPGTVLKKLCPKEEKCFYVLMTDVLRPYVPEYKGQVTSDDGELYLQLQDLLSDFNQPCVMDCKIGVRTYLEEELSKAKEKPKLRKDMYEKMIQIDPNAPSDDENKAKGVTKPRYMVWRETISSTATLGFRIEGIKKGDGTSSKDFKTTKSKEQILAAFKDFTQGFPHAVTKYIHRLRAIRATLDCSNFFLTHEVIGSSLLFVHDHKQASIWLIDFAKTVILPTDMLIDHNTKWSVGNHEDGYLIGITNLIEIFEELQLQMNCNDDAMMLTKMPMPITMVNTINTYSGNSQCSGVSNSNSSSNNINSTNNNNDNKNNNSNDSSQHKHPHSGVPNNELTMDEMKNDTHMLANNVTEQFENTSLN